MPRVVLLSLPVPPTSAPSLLSHILHFCCPELFLSAHKAMSFIICHHLWETRMTAYLTARQAVSFSVRLTEFRFSDMGTHVLGKVTLPQLQDMAWPWQSHALSPSFPVMAEHGHMTILASNTGNLRNFDSCYIENHWEASCLLPFWLSCLACEGMMELQSPYDRAGKTKRIFKQPTQSCGYFEPPTSRVLKHDSKVTQIMLFRTSVWEPLDQAISLGLGSPSNFSPSTGPTYLSPIYSSISFLGKSLTVPS